MNLDALALMLLTVLQTPPTSEYRERRERLLARHADGIVLLHARSTAAGLGDQGFKQDASFFYLTGLVSQPSAILALDGPKREAVLFVPDAPRSFGFPVAGVSLEPGEASARMWELDRVVSWDELVPFLNARISDGLDTLYLDEARRPPPPGNPDALAPMAGGTCALAPRASGEVSERHAGLCGGNDPGHALGEVGQRGGRAA